MKKVLAIALIGTAVLSCSKKNDKSWQDSNNMLPEPETSVSDSASAQPKDAKIEAAASDSVKSDTAKANTEVGGYR